jgi:hypothetical protein
LGGTETAHRIVIMATDQHIERLIGLPGATMLRIAHAWHEMAQWAERRTRRLSELECLSPEEDRQGN